jgi:Tfp pilus assembly protein PilF
MFWGFLFLGCKATVNDGAFNAKIAEADVLITSGSPRAGLRIINGLAKRALGVPQRLGLYRRYRELGETGVAEKWLAAWLKQQPDSPELNASYVWLLIEQQRFPEAEEQAARLAGTAFSSLIAELRFRKILNENNADSAGAFKNILPDLFYRSYRGSKNKAYLEDAAILFAADENIEQAADIHPGLSQTLPEKSLLFWASVLLDAGKIPEALTYLNAVPPDASPAIRLETMLLRADALGGMGDDEAAQTIREEILHGYAASDVPPVTLYNSARNAEIRGDTNTRYVLLTSLARQWPDYAPGLAAYGRYALEAAPPRPETGLEKYVRASGLKTDSMAAEDTIPRIPVETAFHALERAAERNTSLDALVEYLKFDHLLNYQDTKFARLWDFLEQNLLPDNSYPPELARCAVSFLFASGQDALGAEFFERYIRFRYHETDPTALLLRLAPWEIETFALLAAQKGKTAQAISFYRHLIEGVDTLHPAAVHERFYRPPIPVLVNLAELYQGTGRLKEGIELYRQALEAVAVARQPAGMAAIPRIEILYRLGKAQRDNRDIRQAARTMEECLAIDPSFQKARLLLREL